MTQKQASPPTPLHDALRAIERGEKLERISIYAPTYDPYDGYGRMALELVAWLNALGVQTNVMGTPHTQILRDTQTDEVQALLQKPIQITTGGLMVGYPTLREQYSPMLSAGKSVAITMFESTRLPAGWVESLNRCAAVIVPSRWNVEAFKACGVKVPIHCVPLGVSEIFQPVKRERGEPFTYLCWGDRGMRKGWDLACAAFLKAFGKRDDVRLVIKVRDGDFEGVRFTYEGEPLVNVSLCREDFDEEGLQEFYTGVDCMVFPSRGEGFGLPPREFAATAGPVICTRWWADDIEQWGYPVKYAMSPAWAGNEKFEGLGEWAEADVDHLAQQMLHVFNQNPKLIAYMGQKSAQKIRKLYSWEQFAKDVWAIWQTPTLALPHSNRGGNRSVNIPQTGNIQVGRERRKERKAHAAQR